MKHVDISGIRIDFGDETCTYRFIADEQLVIMEAIKNAL